MHELKMEHGGKCKICGYKRCIRALKFHHKDDNKEFGISNKGITLAIETLRREASKCILVCGNCHDEIHDGMHPDCTVR